MRVKRYVVDSMPDALQKIRSDLGKDAVILNTKEIRSGGFLGFFGKKRIEVIAATDSPAGAGQSAAGSKAEPKARAAAAPPKASAAKPSAAARMTEAVSETEAATVPTTPLNAAGSAYLKTAPGARKAAQVALLDEPMPYVPDVLTDHQASPARSFSDHPVKDKRPAVQPEPPAAGKSREDYLLEELRQMKEMMNKLARASRDPAALPPVLQEMEARLVEQEVAPDIADSIVQAVAGELEASDEAATPETALPLIRRQLEQIVKTPPGTHLAADTEIAHFVGPTGVGKTTTIAKLAAEQVLKHRRKVGFITSDTYRIAAIEQLKTYATILNIPLEVVFTPQDLRKAFANLHDRDLIFMDTAGRNFRNEMYVSELNALLQSKSKSETFLVLSMTMKYKDMKAITSNFMKFKLDKVLFTKMDETDSYGAIVNLLYDFPLHLSYVTNGQNVPEDIALADQKLIIDHLVGDTSHE